LRRLVGTLYYYPANRQEEPCTAGAGQLAYAVVLFASKMLRFSAISGEAHTVE